MYEKGSYGYDIDFLRKYDNTVELKNGPEVSLIQSAYNFERREEELDSICMQVFDFSIEQIKSAFGG